MDIDKQVSYWIENAQQKWETAEILLDKKKHTDCLFFCHLTLECLLKALVIKDTGTEAPFIHNLIRLAEMTELLLTKSQKELLKIVTTFNLRTRYEDYKRSFYKRATRGYTQKYVRACNTLQLWLRKKLQNGQ